MPPEGPAPGPGSEATPPARPVSREVRRRELRQRRRRRLLPLVAVLVVGTVVAVVVVHGTSPSPSAGSGPPAGSGSAGHRSGGPSTSRPATTTTTAPAYLPPAVAPVVTPALTGEGQWVAQDPWSPAPPAVMTTTFRPDVAQPGIVAYAAWMRTSTTLIGLYPGYKGPGPTAVGVDRGQEMVPPAARSSLLATFNSGFYEADAPGGFYAHGTLFFPMVDGLATVVSYTDGSVDIVDWQSGNTPGPDVVMARQNLPLLVDGGAPTATTSVGSVWGSTLGGVPAVWRTGLGIDARGNLIYVAAPAQTAASLAQILIDLGAVRAMQLDINPEWPIFVTYGGPGAVSPTLFVPNPNQIASRFLYSSTKDFFALYQRTPGEVDQPW